MIFLIGQRVVLVLQVKVFIGVQQTKVTTYKLYFKSLKEAVYIVIKRSVVSRHSEGHIHRRNASG